MTITKVSLPRVGWLAACALFVATNLLFLSATNLNDFSSFVKAGRALASGTDPYDTSDGRSTNLNPPISLLFLKHLTNVEPQAAYRIWQFVSAFLYAAVLVIWHREHSSLLTPLRVGWLAAFAPFWYTLLMGQVYVVLLIFVVAIWSAIRHSRLCLAGVLLGLLVALKPNLVVWPLLLFVAGSHTLALVALALAALFSAVPLLLYGPTIYLDWLQAVAAFPAVEYTTNASLSGWITRLGVPSLSFPLAMLLAAFVGLVVWRRRPDMLATSAVAIPTALLVAPSAWVGYALLLLPAFAVYQSRWLTLSSVLLLIPAPLVFLAGSYAPVLAGTIYPLALLLVIFSGLQMTGQNPSKWTNLAAPVIIKVES